jgi:glycosyltransferase involved in cell wall biosynthesis
MSTLPTYALITPARDEAQFIELTLKSVVAQAVRPLKWVVVSDGSTDSTDEIVRRYAAAHSWIELVCLPERRERHFAGKVQAFNAGQARLVGLQYDVIGNLDADVSFDENYFSFLLRKLAEDSTLGVVGTAFQYEAGKAYDYRFVSVEHVTGCCQLFRRECFEKIGGYMPVKGGAVDCIAVIAARTNGWKTRTFTEKTYIHHREMGTAQQGQLKARFKYGAKDYAIGNHPLWEVCRTIYQMAQKPLVLGGMALLAGYLWSPLRGVKRPVSDEMIALQQRDQMRRLRVFVKKAVSLSLFKRTLPCP